MTPPKSPSLASLWMSLAFCMISFRETSSVFALCSWINSRTSIKINLCKFLPSSLNLLRYLPPFFWATLAKVSIITRRSRPFLHQHCIFLQLLYMSSLLWVQQLSWIPGWKIFLSLFYQGMHIPRTFSSANEPHCNASKQ